MKKLYFIAILFEPVIEQKVQQLKQAARDKFASKRALRSPAHITFVPPFHYPEQQISQLTALINRFPLTLKPITLCGAGHFGKRVIYVRCDQHQHLRHYKQQLDNMLAPYGIVKAESRFHPHITIAFKDLKTERFAAAWHYFQSRCELGKSTAYRLAVLESRPDGWHVLTQ